MKTNLEAITALSFITFRTIAGADVYSTFLTKDGDRTGGNNFDIGNDACFPAPGAHSIKFTQAGLSHNFNGPYCLNAFIKAGCPPNSAGGTQPFRNVHGNDGDTYKLTHGGAKAGYYRWQTAQCGAANQGHSFAGSVMSSSSTPPVLAMPTFFIPSRLTK